MINMEKEPDAYGIVDDLGNLVGCSLTQTHALSLIHLEHESDGFIVPLYRGRMPLLVQALELIATFDHEQSPVFGDGNPDRPRSESAVAERMAFIARNALKEIER